MVSKYANIKIPRSLAIEMDKLVGQFGFNTRAEIAREAIRKLLFTFNNPKEANPT